MNRENKRKQYDPHYYRHNPCNDSFTCKNCGRLCVPEGAGSDHRKFIRQIFVSVDITAPLYWWKEFDTYKVGTVANSTSTMHKIHAKAFEREDFSCDRLDEPALAMLDAVIDFIESERCRYNETKDKQAWHNMIQLLPASFNQMRTVTLNYENRRVGVQRYYDAKQAQTTVSRVIRVQHTATEITPQNKAVTEDGREYRIDLIQFVPDVYPPSDDLTLVAYRQGAPL